MNKREKKVKRNFKKQKTQETQKYFRRQKAQDAGITLIALVVTIIVLLILAGVSISTLLGQNGLIGRSRNATTINQKASVIESAKQDILEKQIEKASTDSDIDITEGDLKEILNKYFKDVDSKDVTDPNTELTANDDNGGDNVKVKISDLYDGSIKSAVAPSTTEPDVAVTFSTAYGTIDVVWLDTNNNVISAPNSPVLNGMTPVVFNSTSSAWDSTTSSSSDWYDYSSNKWANARTVNNSYFVWIPRFAYRITYYESSSSTTPTGYYDGNGMWDAVNKKKKYNLDSGIETVNVEKDGKIYSYIVHLAFETDLDNGGWDSDLSGFWFAKFEMGTTTETGLNSTYGTANLRNQNIGTQYKTARSATYGMTTGLTKETENGNRYTSFMNSHMSKNSEWGAVAYLTHSKYGRNGTEITINSNSSYYRGGGSGTAYISNVAQSTTGNVYGVYDMSGGTWEYTAGFNSSDTNGCLSTYKWTTYTGLTVSSNSTKYATKYNNSGSDCGNASIYQAGKVGDAIKEVNTGGAYNNTDTSHHRNWFLDTGYIINTSYPFSVRGGNYGHGSYAGVFCSNHINGDGGTYSFRSVLCP